MSNSNINFRPNTMQAQVNAMPGAMSKKEYLKDNKNILL